MSTRRIGWMGLLAAWTFWVPGTVPVSAWAADIVVTSATPASGEQGTLQLQVTIKGSGFPKKPLVRFCRTDSASATCDPDRITVVSAVVKGSSIIEAAIDIGPDASTTSFDIEVVETLSGRKGRGTKLFAVLKKPSAEPQRPDPVVIEQVDAIENSISIAWPVPVDPSGTVTVFDVRYGTSPVSTANFDAAEPVPPGMLNAGPMGSRNTLSIRNLEPGTRYFIAVRAMNDKGEASEIGPQSTVEAVTTPTYPSSHNASWRSETIESIVEYPGTRFGPCCRLEKLDFDANGTPAVAYQVPGSAEVMPAVRYALQTATGWALENAFDGSVDGISDLRHAPGNAGAGLNAGAGSLLAVQTVRTQVRKNQYTYVTTPYFLFRTVAAAWSREVVPHKLPEEPEFQYFRQGTAWKPGTVLTEQVTQPDNSTVGRLSLVAREPVGGTAQWTKASVFDCSGSPGTSIAYPEMLVNHDGALDLVLQLAAGVDKWILVAHRDAESGAWTFRRTGLYQGAAAFEKFAMDDVGRLYAVVIAPDPGDSAVHDVVLHEDIQLEDLPAGATPCSVPQGSFVGTSTVIDHGAYADVYAPAYPDGRIVGTLPYVGGGISGIAFEYPEGAPDPAVHIMFERDDGNHSIREQRVLSRCAGPGSAWYRDAVDRAYGDTESRAAFSYGPAYGIAWAHHAGRHSRVTNFASYEERMLLSYREGSVCSAP